MSDLKPLLEQTIRRHIRSDASVVGIETRPMREHERGYSGAQLNRHTVTFRTTPGEEEVVTLITEAAPPLERGYWPSRVSRGSASHSIIRST